MMDQMRIHATENNRSLLIFTSFYVEYVLDILDIEQPTPHQ